MNPRKMSKRKTSPKKAKKALDKDSEKRGPGRPGVSTAEFEMRAYDLTLTLRQNWDQARNAFLLAKTKREFTRSWKQVSAYLRQKFPEDLFRLVIDTRKDPAFPKKEATMPGFFGDCLAGMGKVSPRTSRDLTLKERRKNRFRITRRDSYIECSCGYEGIAWYGSCPECGTELLGNLELAREAGLRFERPEPPKKLRIVT